MNEATPPKEERTAALSGLGTSRKRVEDARFTQGKGNYVDDLKLPGMLFGDFVRSPYAHARVKSINTEKALALPGRPCCPDRCRSRAAGPALDADPGR